jgi:hypothetical protein
MLEMPAVVIPISTVFNGGQWRVHIRESSSTEWRTILKEVR